MFSDNDRYKPETCPGCGKPDSAVFGSSEWGHNLLCCSGECGEKVAGILNENECSDEYVRAEKALERAKKKLDSVRMRGLFSGHGHD